MIIVSPSPCPPEEFSGRHREREDIQNILACVKDRGQVILISGAVGSGKSSLLRWAAEEIQKSGGHENLVITKEFYETPGMAFKIYRDLLKDLQSHTRGGRFRAIIGNDKVIKSLDMALELLETFTPATEPVGTLSRILKIIKRAAASPQEAEHEHVLSSILDVFQKISVELKKNDRVIAILLDDVQWSSEPDFRLLKDLIRNIPPNIALLLTFRREDKTNQMYEELMGLLNRWDQTEIPLYRLESAEIMDFAARRYNLSLDESAARYLEQKVGDPFSLVVCFNLLQKKGLNPSVYTLEMILPEALEKPAKSFLSGLDQSSRDRINQLCILIPPIPFSVIACITGTQPQDEARLQSDLDNSIVFRRIEHGLYDFGHSSLREYCRHELPEIQKVELHKKAAKCFENLLDNLPDEQYAALSLAEHTFYGEDYQAALDLNFALGELAYAHYDYLTALELMGRAKISAEKLNDRDMLAATYHHLGMVFQALYKYSVALECYTQSLTIARELGNRGGETTTLHQIGMVHQMMHRYDEALDYYNQSLAIKRELGNRAYEASTLHQIGTVYEATHRYAEALDYYNQSLAIARDLGNRAYEANTLHQIGMMYQKKHRYNEALDCYTRSLAIIRELGNRGDEAKALHQIGAVYLAMHRYGEAMDCYTQSLAIRRELGDRAGEAGTLHQIGIVYQVMHWYAEAMECYNQSLAVERELDNRGDEASTLHQIGTVYQAMHRYDEALDYYNQSLAIRRKLGDRDGEAETLLQIGIAYLLTHRYDEAMDYCTQSLTIERELGDRDGEAETLLQIGAVYQAMQRYVEVLDYYNQSLAIMRELGNRDGEATSLHQIGTVYQAMHQYVVALDHYNQSLAIVRELGNRNGEARTLHQIGMVHGEGDRYDEALDCYNQSLAIARELGNRGDEAGTLHQIGIVYQAMQRYDEALDCYNQSLAIARELGNLGNEASTLHQIGTVYQAMHRYDEALNYYDQSLAIKQELGNRDGEVLTLAQMATLFGEISDPDEAIWCSGIALFIAAEHKMPVVSQIILYLAALLDQMGDERFTAAWRKVFNGANPPIDRIQEIKRLLEEKAGMG